MIESSREKNHDRAGTDPPSTLALLQAMPARIDVDWLFPTPGSADTRRPRIEWPSYEELQQALEATTYKALSRKLRVSDNALRNRMHAHQAGRRPGDGSSNDGGKLWRYDNWMRDVWKPTVELTGMTAIPKDFRGQLGDTPDRRRRQHRRRGGNRWALDQRAGRALPAGAQPLLRVH